MKPIYKCNLYALKMPINVYQDYSKSENIAKSETEFVKEIFVQPFFGKYREIITHMSFSYYIWFALKWEYYVIPKEFLFIRVYCNDYDMSYADWRRFVKKPLHLAKASEMEEYIIQNKDTLKDELTDLKLRLQQSYEESYNQNIYSPKYIEEMREREKKLNLLKSLKK